MKLFKSLLLLLFLILPIIISFNVYSNDNSLTLLKKKVETYNKSKSKKARILDLYKIKEDLRILYEANKHDKKIIKEINRISNSIRIPKDFKLVEKKLHLVWFGNLKDKQIEYYKLWKIFSDRSDLTTAIWTDKRITLSHTINSLIKDLVKRNIEKNKEKYETYNFKTFQKKAINKIIKYQDLIYKEIIRDHENNIIELHYDYKVISSTYIHKLLNPENPDLIKSFLKEKRNQNLSSYSREELKYNIVDIKSLYFKNPKLYKIYFKEMALRVNLAAASDITRLMVLYYNGGYYVDFDNLPPLKGYYDERQELLLEKTNDLLNQGLYSNEIDFNIEFRNLYVHKDLLSVSRYRFNTDQTTKFANQPVIANNRLIAKRIKIENKYKSS